MNDPILNTVTLEGFHFTREGKGGMFKAPLTQSPEEGGFGSTWDPETLTLSYFTPNPDDENGDPVDPTPQSLTFTQEEIDAALSDRVTPALSVLRERQIAKIAEACQNEYSSDIVSSDGIPFRAHLEANIDVQMLVESLAPGEAFAGYKCADGQFRDITREQFQTALSEGVTRKVTAFAKRKLLTEQINSASTQAEIQAIEW